jgi:hypothetical protein
MTSPRLIATALAATGIAAAAPAAANASTFCVNDPSCNGGIGRTGLQDALEAARNDPGPDTIRLGARPDGQAYTGTFTYTGADDNTIALEGVGATPPAIAPAPLTGDALTIASGQQSTIRRLRILAPAGAGRLGASLTRVDASDLTLTGGGPGSIGLRLIGSSLTGSRIDAGAGTGLDAPGGQARIAGSTIAGDTAIAASGAVLGVDASRLHGIHAGIDQTGTANPSRTALVVQRSEITTSAPDGDGITATADPNVTILRSTIASRSSAPSETSTGFVGLADGHDMTIRLQGALIAGYRRGVVTSEVDDFFRVALTLTGSEWDPSRDGIQGTITQTEDVHAEPKLADRPGGDLRLRAGDGAIDRLTGTLAAVRGLDGLAPRDGDGNGSALADAGALEFVPPPAPAPKPAPTPAPVPAPTPAPLPRPAPKPDRTAPSLTKLSLSGRTLKLRLRSSERATVTLRLAHHRRATTFRVRKGANTVALKARLKRLGALKRGRHTLTLSARDGAGNRGKARTLRLTRR